MMISLQSYVRRGTLFLRRVALDPRLHRASQAALYFLAGFFFSAASLGNYCLPLAMGFVCASTGWSALLSAVGGCMGYWLFWGSAGYIGLAWTLAALPTAVLLADRRIFRQTPLLLPAVAGLIVAASGVVFQFVFHDATPIPIYLVRIALGASTALLFGKLLQGRNPILDWLSTGFLILSLSGRYFHITIGTILVSIFSLVSFSSRRLSI